MKKHFVLVSFDIECVWNEITPVYQVFVNDELFSEREWRWHDHYLTEILQILAVAGTYQITVQPAGNKNFTLAVKNHRVEVGPARWTEDHQLIILDES